MLLMLMAPLISYAQTSYPVKTVIGSDTCIIISLEQGRSINVAFVELQGCQDETSRLKMVIDTAAQIVHVQQEQIADKDQELKLKQDIINQQKGVNLNLDKEIVSLTRKDKVSKFERNILFLAAGFLALKLFVFK